MSESDSETEVAHLLSSSSSSSSNFPFLNHADDSTDSLAQAFHDAESTPVPVYIEMIPHDIHITQDPVDQAYDEYTYAISRHLDLFYYRNGYAQPLEDYAKFIYDGWTTIFPNPSVLGHVKERAGDDMEKAAKILEKALLTDSAMARSRYRWKIENHQDEEGFWQPKHVRAGLVTFEYLVKRTVRWDNFSRWSSREYVEAVAKLKQARDEMKAAERVVHSYPYLKNPNVSHPDAVEIWDGAKNTAAKSLREFLQKKIIVHVA